MKVSLLIALMLTGCAATSFPDGVACPSGENCTSSYNQNQCQGANSSLITCVDSCHKGAFTYCQTTREIRDRSR